MTAVLDDVNAYYVAFGTDSTWTHSSAPKSVSVIFDRSGTVEVVGDVQFRNAVPVARVRQSEFSGVAKGDTLLISSTTYYVTDVDPINNEEYVLHLSLTPP
jgi:hypothetical protein